MDFGTAMVVCTAIVCGTVFLTVVAVKGMSLAKVFGVEDKDDGNNE